LLDLLLGFKYTRLDGIEMLHKWKNKSFSRVLLLSVLATWLVAFTIGCGGGGDSSHTGAGNVAPVGVKVATDAQGHSIYQIDANGIKIGYKLIGSGSPLLMINGIGNTTDDWSPEVIQELSKKHQLILMDYRGMGYTTANEEPFTEQMMAGDAIALLDSLGINKADILGYSLGSTFVQSALLNYPEHLNKVILHATSMDGSNVASQLEQMIAPKKLTDLPVMLQRYVAMTTKWKTPLDKLPLVTNQVMLVVGTADTTVGIESSRTIAGLIPGAWLVQFKNGTHKLMHESPIEFSKAVSAFLDINETAPE
jgi:pimeloyl-ACP methyl ester carboxylesterase